MKYSIIRLLFCLHIEKIHRLIYDQFYLQSYKLKITDKFFIKYYSILTSFQPNFRQFLKYYKPILNKAYSQHRLSLINQIGFNIIRKRNIERYS